MNVVALTADKLRDVPKSQTAKPDVPPITAAKSNRNPSTSPRRYPRPAVLFLPGPQYCGC